MVILILIAILVVITILVVLVLSNNSLLKQCFNNGNVIVFGKKGKGKDLLFQKVINMRKKKYLSNINYGNSFCKINPLDLNLGTNSYENFIHNDVEIIEKDSLSFENTDIYFSDCGVILPSQYDYLLHKEYKGFPLSYALSRHLWHNNIHCNTQALGRVWKALREQADSYICCKGVVRLPFVLIIKWTYYDKYSSAENGLSPLSARSLNSFSRAETDQYIAMNGNIRNGFSIIRKNRIYYDTRAYHRIIFGKDAPKSEG